VIHITDHAMLRFLERAGGLDVDGLRNDLELALRRAGACAKRLGAQRYVVLADGLRFVVVQDHVVTITVQPRGSK
jgi:hypothetical protein